MSKRIEKFERTRQALIETAFKLFISNGFHGTTTREIAKLANTATGTIYNHFENKGKIFEAILECFHPWVFIPKAVSAAEGDSLESFVHDAADKLHAIWKKNAGITKVHLIELLEFQGKHLPELFHRIYDDVSMVVDEKVLEYPFLKVVPKYQGMRALISLFFALQYANDVEGIGFDQDFDDSAYDYFADTYLQGFLSQVNRKS